MLTGACIAEPILRLPPPKAATNSTSAEAPGSRACSRRHLAGAPCHRACMAQAFAQQLRLLLRVPPWGLSPAVSASVALLGWECLHRMLHCICCPCCSAKPPY